MVYAVEPEQADRSVLTLVNELVQHQLDEREAG
jgi:hypothetical protein